jgi:hypothetical protein
MNRLDYSHRHREYANVYEALVYLQHDMTMSKVNQHELSVTEDLDESRLYEVELNVIK